MKAVNLSKINIIHAHLKYIWNKSTKNSKETLKALRGADFTKYALPTIIVYKQWSIKRLY